MKLSPGSSSHLLPLLLLAQLIGSTLSRPTSIYDQLMLMSKEARILGVQARTLLNSVEEEFEQSGRADEETVEPSLNSLPRMEYSARHLTTLQLNESLSELHSDLQNFLLHFDWLKELRENMSLPQLPGTLEVASQLRRLSTRCAAALQKMECSPPQAPPLSFPSPRQAFYVLPISKEIAEHFTLYCSWSSRVLLQLITLARRL